MMVSDGAMTNVLRGRTLESDFGREDTRISQIAYLAGAISALA